MNDPYSPPQAEIRIDNRGGKGRGFVVWLIVLFMGGNSLLSCISLSMPILGWEVSNLNDRKFFSSLNVFDWVLVYLPHLSILVSCYFLFKMKKKAVRLWAISIFLMMLSSGNIALKRDLVASGGELWLAILFSATMLLVIQVYIWRLSAKRRLV